MRYDLTIYDIMKGMLDGTYTEGTVFEADYKSRFTVENNRWGIGNLYLQWMNEAGEQGNEYDKSSIVGITAITLNSKYKMIHQPKRSYREIDTLEALHKISSDNTKDLYYRINNGNHIKFIDISVLSNIYNPDNKRFVSFYVLEEGAFV